MDAVAGEGDSGVRGGRELAQFVDAIAGWDPHELERARRAVTETLGEQVMVDAAAVSANFHMMTRIADSTGTPLDSGSVDMSAQLREEIGVNDLTSRRHVE